MCSSDLIETTVIVDDRQILVLGGLMEDVLRESEQRVPILGSLPVIGNLFRVRKTDKIKTNLLIFIRPTILRDSAQTILETNAKYNYIRGIQQGNRGTSVQLMPGQHRSILLPLDLYSNPIG
mgnify:CR=1 FL=1